jgi:hypothetical protein
MRSARIAIDRVIGLNVELRNILSTNVAVGVDPHRGHAGGAQIALAKRSFEMICSCPRQ